MIRGLRVSFAVAVLLAVAWEGIAESLRLPPCREVTPRMIALEGPIGARSAEISGMDWYGDHLVLLPQYPRNELYAIPRATILAYIENENASPIEPVSIPFSQLDLPKRVPGFEGYEAIAFHGDKVYFAIEAREAEGMAAWVASGTIDPQSRAIRMDPEHMVRLPLDLPLANMSVESLVVLADGNLLAIPEVIGKVVATYTRVLAVVVSPELEIVDNRTLRSLEYRITDATTLHDNGFWVMNYFWPGERHLLQAPELASVSPCDLGESHTREDHVERIVRMAWREGMYQESGAIHLELETETPRNWEALVRLDDRGFLLMTDEHPSTLFAFVPYPEK